MKTKLSTPEGMPIVSRLALFLSIFCCVGFIHVEIKLHSQDEFISCLVREIRPHEKDPRQHQLPSSQDDALTDFAVWLSYTSANNGKTQTSKIGRKSADGSTDGTNRHRFDKTGNIKPGK